MPGWKQTLSQLRKAAWWSGRVGPVQLQQPFPTNRRLVYLIDLAQTQEQRRGVVVQVMTQKRLREDTWDRPKKSSLSESQWLNAPDEADRMLALLLMGAREQTYYSSNGSSFTVPVNRFDSILRRMCETGRCGALFYPKQESFRPLQWDAGGMWQFCLEISRSVGEKFVVVNGLFQRGEERMTLHQPFVTLPDGLLLTETHAAAVDYGGAWPLVQALRNRQEIKAPVEQIDDLMNELGAMPHLPHMQIAEDLGVEVVQAAPIRRLHLTRPRGFEVGERKLHAKISFEYDGQIFQAEDPAGAKLDGERRRLIRRDRDVESKVPGKLNAMGFRHEWSYRGMQWILPDALLHRAVMELTSAGWMVEAEGSIYRRPGKSQLEIRSSGIDWFELDGGIEFEGKLVALPKLLAALERGEQTVRLDDGSLGMLPTAWLNKYARFAGMGEASGDVVKFGKSQVGLLDALLAAMPEARCDETFQKVRQEVRHFERIYPFDAPEGFGGTLRPYQRDGLGWLMFLQQFGFGGCLADDMGLGKTVQVLALLEMRRRAQAGPTLVVVPRSLVFNWKAEAGRFTPQMRVLDHTGMTRTRAADHFSQFDLIITTYGTLRRDAAFLRETIFDYVILDEAQNIKNASTEAAKATRLFARQASPGAHRHADRKSAGGFMEPVRVPQSRDARRGFGFSAACRQRSQRRGPADSRAGASAVHSSPHQAAGGNRSARKTRANHLLRSR